MALGPMGTWGGDPWSFSAALFGILAAAGIGLILPALVRAVEHALSRGSSAHRASGFLSSWMGVPSVRIRWGAAGFVFVLQMAGFLPLLVFFAGVVGVFAWALAWGIERFDIRSGPLYEFRRSYSPFLLGTTPPPPSSTSPPPAVPRESIPGFDADRFLQRVGTGWDRLQEAWCAQDLGPVASLMTDGLAAKLDAQLATQKRAGYRDRLDNRRILSKSVETCEVGDPFSAVTVRIEATADDHDIDLHTGEAIAGRTISGRFVEHWTFLRAGSATDPAKGLLEGSCPCCGAGLSLEAPASCPQCGSWIRGGAHDWLLSEITQDGPSTGSPSPSLDGLRAFDPAISRQALEDRASWAFWRLVRAWNEGRPDLANAAATAPFLTEYVNRVPSTYSGRFLDPVVSAVELVSASRTGEGDEAMVRLRWNPGPGMEGNRQTIHGPTLRLRRPAGSTTRLETSLAAGHCPSCGGAESNPFAVACSWCGTPSGSASLDWKIAAVEGSGHESGL